MIITRTPLRISFVGGGSDRPSFYAEEPGACVAAAIDKFVYVVVNPKYDGSIRVAYSQTEDVQRLDDLQHELAREALRLTRYGSAIEVHSIADIPGGTGLGSSSSFTVGLLAALRTRIGQITPRYLATYACDIELDMCKKPIGKQDQYTAAYGGLSLLGFTRDGVTVSPIACDLDALSAHCLLLDTGMARSSDAGAVLAAQTQDRDDVRRLAKLAELFADDLAGGNLNGCGALMHMAWEVKSRFIRNAQIDVWYAQARDWGAWGGKLCGAGGGGFLLFLAPPERHSAIVAALGLRHVPIRVGANGSEVIYAST